MNKFSKLCCIGAGYVGGPTSAIIALKCPEINVVVVDCNKKRINEWNSNDLPIKEPGLLDVTLKCRNRNLFFSSDVEYHVNDADIIFICVNTPTKDYGFGEGQAADLTTLEVVTRMIASCCKMSKVVVEKSTVPVRSAARISQLLNSSAKNEYGKSLKHAVLSNPEFLAEGTAITNLCEPDRVLIGGERCCPLSRRGISMLIWMYSHWVPKKNIIVTSVWSSELSKLAANAFLAQRISSINAVSAICEVTGADVREVSTIVGLDPRIGPHFLQASLGFGGSCFKKDILNLTHICKHLSLHEVASYWDGVVKMNKYQSERFANTIFDSMFGNLNNKKIAIFGFAFKKDTGDTRETPALPVCLMLLCEHANLAIYDPQVSHDQIIQDFCKTTDFKIVNRKVTIYESALDASQGAHAIVICTEWDEFKTIDYKEIYNVMEKPAFLFDGRLITDHKELINIGFHVKMIGLNLD